MPTTTATEKTLHFLTYGYVSGRAKEGVEHDRVER